MKRSIICFLEIYLITFLSYGIEYISPKYYCTITPPDSITCVNFVINSSNELFLIPYSTFAVTFLYKFDLNSCEFKNTIVYPDEVKYCFIPKTDIITWEKIESSNLVCYPCTFSFRQIFPEFYSGNIYAWAYSLTKKGENDTIFIPKKVIFRLDTNIINPVILEQKGISLFPFGKSPLKGDTLVCFVNKRIGQIEESGLYLFNLKSKNYKEILNLNIIEKDLTKKTSEIGQTYYLFDSLLVFYYYSHGLPIIINLNNNEYRFFKYSGQLEILKDANFHISIDSNGDSVRTFMHKFLLNDQYLTVVGGEEYGSNFENYSLRKIFLQFYSPDNFSLQKEFEIKLLDDKNYSFFDCFVSPINKSRIVFLIKESQRNNYDIYFLDL